MSKDITIEIPRRAAIVATCLGLGALFGVAATSFADGEIATNGTRIPYRGFLMQDSTPIDGTATVRFRIYHSKNETNPANAVFDNVHTVNVKEGWFQTVLTSPGLNAAVLTGRPLWIELSLVEDDGAGGQRIIGLSGRQRIDPAVHALWASRAGDMNVAGDLDVNGVTTVRGNTTFQGEVTTSGPLTFEKDLEVQNDLLMFGGTRVDGTLTVQGMTTIPIDGITPGAFNTSIDDATTGNTHVFTAQDIAAFDQSGMELRALTDPAPGEPIFRVLSTSGVERLRVEHDGEVSTNNDLYVFGNSELGVSGNTTVGGTLTVNGDITNLSTSVTNLTATANSQSTTRTIRQFLTPSNSSVCLLSKVDIIDHDDDDTSGCSIDSASDGGVNKWRLNASARGGNDTITNCAASCLSW